VSSGPSTEKQPNLRFQVAVQKSRALVYTLATVVGYLAVLLGSLRFSWRAGLWFLLVANATALGFGWLYHKGIWRLGHLRLERLWMAVDVGIITWAVHLSGDAQSAWYVWYLANTAAAAFVGGLPALLTVMIANVVAYEALVLATSGFEPTVLAVVAGRMLLLYGAALFALLGAIRLQRKRRQVAELRLLESKRTSDLERLADELREANERLTTALDSVVTLEGLLPICSYCKKIRGDEDYWEQVEKYITEHSAIRFSHGICPECYERHVKPQLDELRRGNETK